MALFSDIGSKFTDWFGIPGILVAFSLSLATWLFYDLILNTTLNSTMMLGVSVCAIIIVAVGKICISVTKMLVSRRRMKPDA